MALAGSGELWRPLEGFEGVWRALKARCENHFFVKGSILSNGAKDPNWRRSKNYNFIRIELKSNYNVKKNVEAERTERCMFLLLRIDAI